MSSIHELQSEAELVDHQQSDLPDPYIQPDEYGEFTGKTTAELNVRVKELEENRRELETQITALISDPEKLRNLQGNAGIEELLRQNRDVVDDLTMATNALFGSYMNEEDTQLN